MQQLIGLMKTENKNPDLIYLPNLTITREKLQTVYDKKLGGNGEYPFQGIPSAEEAPLYNIHHRFADNPTKLDATFPSYNAARIPGSHCVLAEGPNHRDPQAIPRLMANTLLNSKSPIKLFIAVGKTFHDAQHVCDFGDYFQQGAKLAPAAFFSGLLRQSGKAALLDDENLCSHFNKMNNSSFQFYCFTSDNITPPSLDLTTNGFAIYIPTWPDHGVTTFSPDDLHVLLVLTLLDPDILFHCRAGRGRSATLICARLLFREQLCLLNDEQTIIDGYISIVQRMRSVKPSCMYLSEQFILGLELAVSMTHLYQEHKNLYEAFTKQHLRILLQQSSASASSSAPKTNNAAAISALNALAGTTGTLFSESSAAADMPSSSTQQPATKQSQLPVLFQKGISTSTDLVNSLEYILSLVECLHFILNGTAVATDENKHQFISKFQYAAQDISLLVPLIEQLIPMLDKTNDFEQSIIQKTNQILDRIRDAIEKTLKHPLLSEYTHDNPHVRPSIIGWKAFVEKLDKSLKKITMPVTTTAQPLSPWKMALS